MPRTIFGRLQEVRSLVERGDIAALRKNRQKIDKVLSDAFMACMHASKLAELVEQAQALPKRATWYRKEIKRKLS